MGEVARLEKLIRRALGFAEIADADDSVPVHADKGRKHEALGASETSAVQDRRDQSKLAYSQIRHVCSAHTDRRVVICSWLTSDISSSLKRRLISAPSRPQMT